jgi:Transposase and inactivated derivatives
MGYRRMTVEVLYQIFVRLKIGDSRHVIALALGLDKKTVTHYVHRIAKLSFPAETDYVAILAVLATILPANQKPQPAFDVVQEYAQEIKDLIVGDKEAHREGMKAKTAWEVVSRRHELAGKTSYETFKRFVRECPVLYCQPSAVARIEVNPGEEAQIDYGKMGTRQIGDKRKTVYAFSGILSASRLPFIQFCTSQNQTSFAVLIAAMFSFWGGATARINLDNLKAGVLSADIYDPTINRTIAELCEYYGTLADPARIRSPKDKGKVERSIPLSRELYKRLCALANDESLDTLNAQALRWCTDEYGRKKHGTTGIPPMEAFLQVEKPCLRPLPAEPFVPASWTTARVHPDQFIQVHTKYYGLPALYIGRTVDVRITDTLVSIYSQHRVVRQYPVSKKRREYLPEDFPAWAQPFVPNSFASFLANKADMLHPAAGRYIRAIIVDQGNLGLRRAQGCLAILEKSKHHPDFAGIVEHATAYHIFIPAQLRLLFEVQTTQQHLLPFPVSGLGTAMARSATYYTGP